MPTTPPRVAAIGECMIELSRDGDGWRLGYAGDVYNTAVYLSRLGHRVAFVTATGADAFSVDMRAAWAAEGLNADLALVDTSRHPGLYAIRTDERGERRFTYWREASAARALLQLPGADRVLATAAAADLLYLSGITLSLFDAAGRAALVEIARRTRERGGQVAFDSNYRPVGWEDGATARAAITAIMPHVTIALPTHQDERVLFGDLSPAETAARWLGAGARDVVVKLGPAGAMVGDASDLSVVDCTPVAAVDTTGAGDAFNAGYLARRLEGASSRDAAIFAHRLAAVVVGHRGAVVPRSMMAAAFGP